MSFFINLSFHIWKCMGNIPVRCFQQILDGGLALLLWRSFGLPIAWYLLIGFFHLLSWFGAQYFIWVLLACLREEVDLQVVKGIDDFFLDFVVDWVCNWHFQLLEVIGQWVRVFLDDNAAVLLSWVRLILETTLFLQLSGVFMDDTFLFTHYILI